jgi:Ca2+-binding RTX toxin-like protein
VIPAIAACPDGNAIRAPGRLLYLKVGIIRVFLDGADGGVVAITRISPRLLLTALACACGLLLAPLAGQAAAKTCGGKHVTIMGTAGDDKIVGKGASDVIYGGGGNDVIIGGSNGNDTICGGPGNDTIRGGRGFDAIYGEGGDDHLFGETGSDMIEGGEGDDTLSGFKGADHLHGGGGDDTLNGAKGPDTLDGGAGNDFADGAQGSDDVEGGAGDDKLLGDKGNDKVEGGSGDDLIEGGAGDDSDLEGGAGSDTVIGGAGIDDADGGPGDGDVVRGDSGTDTLSGGEGTGDIVSYASATRGGVIVDLATGTAKGDGHDQLSGFEDVVGSPQADTIVGDGSANQLDGGVGNDNLDSGGGGGTAFGGPGDDDCNGFSVENSCGPEIGPPPGVAYAILNQGLDGSSLVVQGGPGNDSIQVSHNDQGWTISDGAAIFPGEGCVSVTSNATAVTCAGESGLALIVVTGNNGDDEITIDPSIPATAKVRVNGNAGSDKLVGGTGDDVLEAGENYNGPDNGQDTLIGNGGDDVLYADPGADVLEGGSGDDLLVSSVEVCQGHRFDGGSGEDTVSYARSDAALHMTLGGTGGPAGCGNPDQILGDNESLEGSDGPDVMTGDNGDNSMLGHLGADTFIAKGGDDFIDAADGHRDKAIICGGGNDEVVKDGSDPTSGC